MAKRRIIKENMCFRCGTTHRLKDERAVGICPDCDELSVVSYQTALDILNDLHRKGIWAPYPDDVDDDTEELNFEY